eukprot:142006_1
MSMTIDGLVANITALLLIYLVIIPLICYYTCKFYKNKSNSLMQHRDPAFVLCLNFLIIFGMLTDRTLKIMVELSQIQIAHYITSFFSGIYTWGIIDLVCIKSYLLFYQHRYHDSIQNMCWKTNINSSWCDWYVQNINTWGKFSYIIRWILVPYLIAIIIETMNETVFGVLFMFIFHLIVLVIPLSLFVFFVARLRSFYDIYGIRKEILGQIAAIIITGFVYFIVNFLFKSVCGSKRCIDAATGYFGSFAIIVSFGIVGISSVYYPLYLLNKQQIQTPNGQSPSSKMTNLVSITKDSKLLSLFMQHLVKQFCTESLLFVIETVQIKSNYQISQNNVIKISNKELLSDINYLTADKYLTIDFNSSSGNQQTVTSTYLLIGDKRVDNMIKIEIELDGLPKSEILTKYPNCIKDQIIALFQKYIQSGSNFEINLPFEAREHLQKLVISENDDNNAIIDSDWFWSLDESLLEILRLLADPFSRFRRTDVFRQYIQSKEYQTKIKAVEMIDIQKTNKPKIYSGDLYQQTFQKYAINKM